MCTIKSIIKGPKLQQMSEGYCLCPAPALLKMHRMDAHCSCCMPVCSEQARVSPSLSFLLDWETYSKWALKLTYSRADNTAVRLSPGSIHWEGILGTWWCLWEQKVSIHQIARIAAKEQWGFRNFLLLKQKQIQQDFNTRKMSRPLSRALVLHQHVGCSARLCVLLETASNCLQPFAKGSHRGESTTLLSFPSTQKTHRKRHKCLFDIIQSIATR